MSIASLEQVKAMLRSMFGVTDRRITEAQENAAKAKEDVVNKMDANNPVGTGSFSMGRDPNSEVGKDSHAEGNYTSAIGEYSHAEGDITYARGVASHAEGSVSQANGEYSHAEGVRTTAKGYCSHAEGVNTDAIGMYSHAEGLGTYAGGVVSHAEGYNARTSGSASHVEGRFTVASSANQHAQGKNNIIDTEDRYAHIVGNGTDNGSSATERSNAHTLDWEGNAWFAGDVYVGGSSQDDGEKLVKQSQLDGLVQDVIAALPVYGGETE